MHKAVRTPRTRGTKRVETLSIHRTPPHRWRRNSSFPPGKNVASNQTQLPICQSLLSYESVHPVRRRDSQHSGAYTLSAHGFSPIDALDCSQVHEVAVYCGVFRSRASESVVLRPKTKIARRSARPVATCGDSILPRITGRMAKPLQVRPI